MADELDLRRLEFGGRMGVHPVFLKLASTFLAAGKVRSTEAIKQVTDGLLDAAESALTDTERTQFYGASVAFEKQMATVVRTFVEALGEKIDAFCQLEQLPDAEDDIDAIFAADDMRILEDADIAETLAVESAVVRTQTRLARDLYALNVRLGALSELSALSSDHNPFSPKPIVDSFVRSLRDVQCDYEHRVFAIEIFDRVMLRSLDGLYLDLNRILIDAGIIPRLRRKLDRKIAPPPQAEGQEKAEEGADHRDSGAEPGTAETTEGGHPGSQPQAYQADPRIESAVQHTKQGYLEGWLYGSIQSMMNRRRGGDAVPVDPAAIVRRDFVARELDTIQRHLRPEKAAGYHYDAIKQQLIQSAQKQGMQHFSAQDETVLDSVGMMFDYMRQDQQLPAPFQSLVNQMQVPFLKAALQQPEMMAQADAPAKQLLNDIATAGQGWNSDSDRGSKLLNKAREIVSKVIDEYGHDSAVFDELRKDFSSFLNKQERRAALAEKRESEAMAGREKLAVARKDVGQILKDMTIERELPTLVDDLLRKSWSHVMVLTRLKHGEESDEWKRVAATAKELIWSVTFKPEPKAIKRLRTRLPVLAKALASGLKKVGYSDSDVRQLLMNLKKVYSQLIRQTGSDQVIIEASAEGLTIRGDDITAYAEEDDGVPVEDIDNPEELEDVLGNIRDWKPGHWVAFHTDDGKEMRAKLSWISPISGRYLFVDHQGLKLGEYSPYDLAENLIGEKVRVLDSDELTTRAMSAVAERLRAEDSRDSKAASG